MKAMLTLAHSELSARVHSEPEYAHPAWNNVLLSIKRAGLQPAMLVSVLLSHVNHGPYSSGKTMEVKRELGEAWIQRMDSNEFEQLREQLAFDRCCDIDDDEVPTEPEQLLAEPTIAARGIFVTCLSNGSEVHLLVCVCVCQLSLLITCHCQGLESCS